LHPDCTLVREVGLAELERNLNHRAGEGRHGRAKLEGRHIGRKPLVFHRAFNLPFFSARMMRAPKSGRDGIFGSVSAVIRPPTRAALEWGTPETFFYFDDMYWKSEGLTGPPASRTVQERGVP
jgi:hypothetical protein